MVTLLQIPELEIMQSPEAHLRQSLLIIASIILGACSSVNDPSAAARVVVTEDTLVAAITQPTALPWLSFTVPYRIVNTGDATLEFTGCGASHLEVLKDDGWRVAWLPGCFLIYSPVSIPRGESLDVELMVGASLGTVDWRNDRVADTYRLNVALYSTSAVERILKPFYSNSFELVPAP